MHAALGHIRAGHRVAIIAADAVAARARFELIVIGDATEWTYTNGRRTATHRSGGQLDTYTPGDPRLRGISPDLIIVDRWDRLTPKTRAAVDVVYHGARAIHDCQLLTD
jgi:hypothetical protein